MGFGTGQNQNGVATFNTAQGQGGKAGGASGATRMSGTGKVPVSGTTKRAIIQNPTAPDEQCQINSLDLEFSTVAVPIAGGAKGDVKLFFQFPHRFFMLVSCDTVHASDDLFIHLAPMGKQYTTNNIPRTGQENWFPFINGYALAVAAAKRMGAVFKVCKPVDTLYLEVGMNSGGAGTSFITVAGTDDIGDILALGSFT